MKSPLLFDTLKRPRRSESGGAFSDPAAPLRRVSKFVIMASPSFLRPVSGKEVNSMDEVRSFFLSVGAGVISYYVCKWLDKQRKGR